MAPSVFKTVRNRFEKSVISKTQTIETTASSILLKRIIPSVEYSSHRKHPILTNSKAARAATRPKNVTIGMERRDAGWKYFLRISAQYTKIKMNMLKSASDPAVRTASLKAAPIQDG